MKANTLTPATLFGLDTRYVVPLFQRPYVWNEKNQWDPLWQDVRLLAESILAASASPRLIRAVPSHFLGAIVLEQVPTSGGSSAAHHVIDGQQRLMTLQLLLDAAEEVTRTAGNATDADELLRLVRNHSINPDAPDDQFKVWPSLRDQVSFRATMHRGAGAAGDDRERVPLARGFFLGAILAWARDDANPPARLQALTTALKDYLRFVVIDLDYGDNAQVIFETLNHRAAPLLAADLIKNLIFQAADAQGLEPVALYERYWADLDSAYWRKHEDPSDESLPRVDVFLRHWLGARLLREVPTDHLYPAFRDYLSSDGSRVEEVLADLAADAQLFAGLESLPAGSVPERFRYRVIQTLDLETMNTLLLRLLRWQEHGLSGEQRDAALAAVESWAVRRALCRIAQKDTLRVVVDLLREYERADPATVGAVTERVLAHDDGAARVWPSDQTVSRALTDAPIYKHIQQRRVRMLLEAIEDHHHRSGTEHRHCPRNLTVEHIMPRGWRHYWSASLPGSGGAGQRDKLVDTIGNLTLLTHELNKTAANRPWTDAEARTHSLGKSGKRTEIQRASRLTMNADLVATNPDAWTEAQIRARTSGLIAAAIQIWQAPPAHAGKGAAAAPLPLRDTDYEPAPRASNLKYEAVTTFLAPQSVSTIRMTFAELEDVLAFPLAPTARVHRRYWMNHKSALAKAIAGGGYRVTDADVTTEVLALGRIKVDRLATTSSRGAAAPRTGAARRGARPRKRARPTQTPHPPPPSPPPVP